MALGLITSATAQTSSSIGQAQDPSEVIALSSYTDGNYFVEQALVMESSPNNREFAVHYKINLSKLISNYSSNSAEIAGLHNFIASIQSDSLKRITNFEIVGYASPDGSLALNERIAAARAKDFCNFVDKECSMAEYDRTVSHEALTWGNAKSALQSSNVPDKSEILSIIDSNSSQDEIEAQIKSHDMAWSYIKEHILPPMRYVEISIHYNSWKLVESRTLIGEAAPQSDAAGVVFVSNGENIGATECPSEGRGSRGAMGQEIGSLSDDCDDYNYCMLVDMPGDMIDFGDGAERDKLKITRHGSKYKELTDEEKIKLKEHARRIRK